MQRTARWLPSDGSTSCGGDRWSRTAATTWRREDLVQRGGGGSWRASRRRGSVADRITTEGVGGDLATRGLCAAGIGGAEQRGRRRRRRESGRRTSDGDRWRANRRRWQIGEAEDGAAADREGSADGGAVSGVARAGAESGRGAVGERERGRRAVRCRGRGHTAIEGGGRWDRSASLGFHRDDG